MKGVLKGLLCVAVLGSVLAASAEAVFPLKVDIDVNTKRSRKMIGAGNNGESKIERVVVNVKVRKSGGQAYTDPLICELYVIGESITTGYYGIIDIIKQEFTFTKENDQSFLLSSPPYSLGQTGGNINMGGVYETYLVVITDAKGNIIDTRSGRIRKDTGIAFIRAQGKGTLFDKKGNVMGQVDKEKATSNFKKASQAAVISVEGN